MEGDKLCSDNTIVAVGFRVIVWQQWTCCGTPLFLVSSGIMLLSWAVFLSIFLSVCLPVYLSGSVFLLWFALIVF